MQKKCCDTGKNESSNRVVGCCEKNVQSKIDPQKSLMITWQRLVFNEETCPRCGSTEEELDTAVVALKQSLAPLGIKVRLEKKELSVDEFKKESLESNRIWF